MPKIKTKPAELLYISVFGEGRNTAMPGEPEPRMKYTVTVRCDENSPTHLDMVDKINKVWKDYKAANNLKGLPVTNGIKKEMIKDPSGVIDPNTEEVKKIPSGKILIQFSTDTIFKNTGKPKVVDIIDAVGKFHTKKFKEAAEREEDSWSIGNGTIGIVHGVAVGNTAGGKQKVTLYLNAIQITKLVKYTGKDLDIEAVEGEALDLDEDHVVESDNPTDVDVSTEEQSPVGLS